MEGGPFNTTQKQTEAAPLNVLPKTDSFPELSFVPDEFLKRAGEASEHGLHERCALFGLILGSIAVVSWIVILFGVVWSILGIVLSVVGLKSSRKKWAQIGLGLSVIGLLLSVWYIYAAYSGMLNYNYFTSEFWGL